MGFSLNKCSLRGLVVCHVASRVRGPGYESRLCRRTLFDFLGVRRVGDPALDKSQILHYLSLELSDFDHFFFQLYLNLMRSPDFYGITCVNHVWVALRPQLRLFGPLETARTLSWLLHCFNIHVYKTGN